MAVTSEVFLTKNVWRFSGVVTDAQLKTAWASLVVNGVYIIDRAIYVDNTADLTGLTGGFLVDFGTQVSPAFILHTARDKTKTTFNNFVFLQRTGLIVSARSSFVQTTNGSSLANAGSSLNIDGISMKGGTFVYGVPGNSGSGDSRFLNEMAWTGFEGVTVMSQEFTEQELQPCVGASTTLKGVTFEKCFGFPQIGTPSTNVNVVVYRSTQNTQHPTQIPVRLYPSSNRYAAVCYIDSYLTRDNADCTTRLVDTFGSSATSVANIMVLNNYTRETWFGATKTNFAITTWVGTNSVFGGVLKKLQFVNGDGGVVRAYDSRSTAVSQKCSFAETGFIDFLNTSLAPTVDVDGKISLVHIGAIATGVGAPITRYTGQKYTFQKFGHRVIVGTPDMTSGDNDLSAFVPVTLTAQNGLVRTQSAIESASSIESYRELLEELHLLAVTSSGSNSYDAAFGGNFFELSGNTLSTAFTSVLVDSTAAQKISYDATANSLVIRSSTLASGVAVSQWANSTGTISTANGATISGVYADINGQRVRVFGLDPEGFGNTWYLRHRVKGTSTWTNLSGTGDQTLVILTAGEYEFQARVPGYDWDDAEIDTSVSLSLDFSLRYHVSANNTPQWEMPFIADLANAFQYDDATNKVAVTNTTANIIQPGFAELYRAMQNIQHLPDLVWTWLSPVTANSTSQKILIPDNNPIEMFLTTASTASVKITCPVIFESTGESADARVRGNADGFGIILGSPATAESAGLQSGIVAALGGANYDSGTASMVVLKSLLDAVQTLTEAVKTKTDNLPESPAAVGSAMTLTSAYDAAKTASSQTSVDAVATSIGELSTDTTSIKTSVEALENYDDSNTQTKLDTLATGVSDLGDSIALTLQAADYVEPPTAEDIAVQVELAIINEDDGLQVIKAIADKIKAEEVTATVIAQTVRQELAVELARIDAATSTRLATADYVEPDNDNILAIKTKVDTLVNTDTSALAKEATLDLLGVAVEAVGDKVDVVGQEVVEVGDKVDNIDLTDITSGLDSIKGTDFDVNKHSLVKIKQETSLAVALSA